MSNLNIRTAAFKCGHSKLLTVLDFDAEIAGLTAQQALDVAEKQIINTICSNCFNSEKELKK